MFLPGLVCDFGFSSAVEVVFRKFGLGPPSSLTRRQPGVKSTDFKRKAVARQRPDEYKRARSCRSEATGTGEDGMRKVWRDSVKDLVDGCTGLGVAGVSV